MINKEAIDWLQKVETGQYSYEDAMYEFMNIAPFLTHEEIIMIKNKVEESFNVTNWVMPDRTSFFNKDK